MSVNVVATASEIVANSLERLLADVAQQYLLACAYAAHDGCPHASGTEQCHYLLVVVSVENHSLLCFRVNVFD